MRLGIELGRILYYMSNPSVAPLVVAEVGVRRGKHAVQLMENLHVCQGYFIDPYEPYQDIGKLWTQEEQDLVYAEAQFNLKGYPRAELLRMRSVDAAAKFKEEGIKFDLVYIDSDHDKVLEDLNAWYPLVSPLGVIVGHDWWHTPIRAALEKFLEPLEEELKTGRLMYMSSRIGLDYEFVIKKNIQQ